MKKPLRLAARISFLLFVLVLLGLGMALAWFTSWRSDKLAALDAGSEVADTNFGKIEYAVHGEGPAVLVFHGAPGGYDQAMLFGAGLAEHGFKVIAPSRPGYLRTPLSTGLLPMQAADAVAALLDSLGIDRVAVLAVDAGAPTAVQFAARYPNRVRALALVSANAIRTEYFPIGVPPELGKEISSGLTGDIGSWYGVKTAEKNPAQAIGWMLDVDSTGDATQREVTTRVILGSAGQLDWFRDLMETFAPESARYEGTRNDQLQIRGEIDPPLKQIKAPTLVVHGALDRVIPLKYAQRAATDIPGATLFEVPDTGHVVWLGPQGAEVEAKIEEFFKQNSASNAQP